jgi:hypothetical protein
MLNFAKFQDMIVDCKKPIILPKYNKVICKVPQLGDEFGQFDPERTQWKVVFAQRKF